MSQTQELTASARERAGKGAARQERREGLVPAVIYGDNKPPVMITLERRLVQKHYLTGHFLSTVYSIDVGGEKHRVLPKAIDLDKVKDFPIHVDFLRIAKGAKVTVEVSMHFLNEDDCPGLVGGGVLNIVRHSVEVECPADAIPESLEADLTGLEVGDSIHISAVKLPEGVVPTITDRDFTVATIAAPAALLSEEAEESDEDEDIEGEEGEGEGDEDGAESEEGEGSED